MGIVLGVFLIGVVVLVLFDGLLHRAMDEPLGQHPVSSTSDRDETEVTAQNEDRDRS